MYAVDSTVTADWDANVHQPAHSIISAYLQVCSTHTTVMPMFIGHVLTLAGGSIMIEPEITL